jgi:hypothetical protein
MSRDVTKITDHGNQALARLAQQYQGKPLMAALLRVFSPLVQQVEDMLYAMQLALRLENAEGVQLDLLGKLVGQPREAADDTQYRLRIAARIKANISTGTVEDLYAVFKILLPSNTLAGAPDFPAGFILDIGTVDPTLFSLYESFFADAKGKGIAGQLWYEVTDAAHDLLLDDAASPSPDSALLGLGDATDDTIGGLLGGAFSGE